MRNLIEYLPPHIAADPETQHIQAALTVVMRKCWAAWEDLLLQTHPQTATWSLPYWKRKYGVASDPTLTVEQRRAVVMARMRSSRTATAEAIANVASALAGGAVAVEEHNSEQRLEIRFLEQIGLPATMEELVKAMEEAAPAHLAVSFIRRCLTIREVEAMTLTELAATPLNHFAGGS